MERFRRLGMGLRHAVPMVQAGCFALRRYTAGYGHVVAQADQGRRLAGAALVAIAVASWPARGDRGSPAQRGLVMGLLSYDVAAAALLTHAALQWDMRGVALWPAVVAHVGLAAWSVIVLRRATS